ncbi:glycosyltransferase family 61 protein [Metabacillus arenae]|uniref:Glycosyltransferase family 61 protein n=1 Tax=Metabacillus arenae TaxID=2771434 RepID=A0A926NJG3_9BACI|nr:glycosyltransferase family 61 protein [Metabacillus arenae]MBD1378981.1 glycosyltransferase family 61 protein [Metabacillus arenae]
MYRENEIKPPEGFYLNTMDWIKETFINKKEIDKYYKEIYSNEIISFPPPKGVDSPRWETKCKFGKAFVAVIPYGRLWGINGSVITSNNKLLWDVSWLNRKTPEEHDIFYQKKLPTFNYSKETVATLAFTTHNNYYHWMFDILPRIHLLNQSGIKVDKYIINGSLKFPELQYETLSVLGIPKNKIIETNDTFHYKAEKVVVSAVPRRLGRIPRWACDFIRNKFLENKKPTFLKEYERIYISRNDTEHRKVINEDELIKFIKPYGFKKVQIKDLSLQDQINLFYSATHIISPSGANLTNIVFCNPRTKIIEFSSTMVCELFWKISNYINLDYYYIKCDAGKKRHDKPMKDDIIVNINKFKEILKMQGL